MTQQGANSEKVDEQLSVLAASSDRILMRCKAIFPFDFFPDSIVISQNKIDIIYSEFFFIKSVHTFLIENILTVQTSVGPIFASLIFEVKGYQQNPPEVRYLPKTSAIRAQEIIMGLVAAKHEGINLQEVSKASVEKQVNQIGSTNEEVSGV